ncbi:member of the karyopherin-beta [Saxophila tyrrhenica]|uniref:Member of the karyopherin-beta n=1 Tax=Saxophila tyrrhenica TaxID=1690608 RepID=A0AAV9P121_9PEZI|nr:member of the karyopherin-beta [Saxophila tyrrhenica]
METEAARPAHRSMADVEQLIKQLYGPGSKQDYTKLNDDLIQLQLSPGGWNLADQLMNSDDANVRFYAALTFIVKLNNDGPNLDENTALSIRSRLIYWLVRLSQEPGKGQFVTRKLCAALVTYFIRSPLPWPRPVVQLAIALDTQQSDVPDSALQSVPSIPRLFWSMPQQQLEVLLCFAETLAEEVSKLSVTQQAFARQHAEMAVSLNDVGELLQWSLGPTVGFAAKSNALPAYAAWANYSQDARFNVEALQPLRALLEQVSNCLLDQSLATEALAILRDRLDCYADFFQPQHMQHLARIIAQHITPQLQRAISEEDTDSVALVQFIVAFGCANIQKVIEDPDNELESRSIIKILTDILTLEGFPGDADSLSVHTIEFWNTYIEYINDTVYSLGSNDEQPAWIAPAKSVLTQTVGLLWNKLWIPSAGVSKGWGDAEHDAFKDFRLDTTDLMLSIFAFLGQDMLEQLVSFTLQSLEMKRWRGVEAALFSLNTLSDNVLEDGTTEQAVEALFRSDLFVQVADFSQTISTQTRRTAIDTLGSYGQYIERHPEFLPNTVRFLFASLEMAGLANAAAKSIDSLCSTCRANLTHEIPGFLAQYERFLGADTNDPYTKQKVIGGIAAIIQALSPESAKAEPLLALLSNIERDVEMAKHYASTGDTEMTELIGVTALQSLTAVGKGLQVPDDIPINIYDDDERPTYQDSFWVSEDGHRVQQRIIGCFSVLSVVGQYGEAVDAACQVLRSGLAETQPGPFVLPPSVTINFLQQCSVTTPQLESVLSTASMLVTGSSKGGHRLADEDATALYASVASFAITLGRPSNDPAVASSCIEFMTRLMPSYTHILLGHITEALLDFTLTAIGSSEPFPKRSACEFWNKLFKTQNDAISADTKDRIRQVIDTFGPRFVFSLVQQIGGRANRSDLDTLCEPLKTLLLHHKHTQKWLQYALEAEGFPSEHVGMGEREKFLRSLSTGVRSDGRLLKTIVKAFWAECRVIDATRLMRPAVLFGPSVKIPPTARVASKVLDQGKRLNTEGSFSNTPLGPIVRKRHAEEDDHDRVWKRRADEDDHDLIHRTRLGRPPCSLPVSEESGDLIELMYPSSKTKQKDEAFQETFSDDSDG